MKDWRDCKKLLATGKKTSVRLFGKDQLITEYNFKICQKCPIKKCKGKILIAAERGQRGHLRRC